MGSCLVPPWSSYVGCSRALCCWWSGRGAEIGSRALPDGPAGGYEVQGLGVLPRVTSPPPHRSWWSNRNSPPIPSHNSTDRQSERPDPPTSHTLQVHSPRQDLGLEVGILPRVTVVGALLSVERTRSWKRISSFAQWQLEIVHLALSAELSKELTDHYNRR